MKKFFNKKFIVIAAVALFLLVTVGSTLAYIIASTGAVQNIFEPSYVACGVVEGDAKPVANGNVNTGVEKTNVRIQNTGDTDAYIRAAVVVNWMTEDGKVWAIKPIEGTDYTITYAENTGWHKGSDRYWYYTKSVPPTSDNNLTGILIENAAQQVDKGPVGTDNAQYYLSVEIVASAIQAKPAYVVESQWGVAVANDGTISK